MDGFDTRTHVIVLAATNRPDMLDPALVRAGRFDRKITVQMPDLEDRKEIIQIHMRGKPFAEDFDLEKVAKKTVGFSGADLENVLNESAIMAAREDRKLITMRDIDEAALKVTLGPERRKLQNENDKKVTAYHEAGHAIVGAFMPDLDPIGRVTIVPRGGSLGHTSIPPERDRYNETRTRLRSMLAMMMGGRAAEELIFNEMTTGAAGDIDKATQVARKMVTEFGMSDLGPIAYHGEEGGWIAKQMGDGSHYSQEMAAKIDDAVKNIIDEAYVKAQELLVKHRKSLDRVSAELLERETIDGEEFKKLLEEVDDTGEKPLSV
jgi:cell division protease FtsH